MKVSPDDGSGVLSQALAFTRHLDLSSEQNNIMINFSNSNYVELEGKDEYQYKLEGFDEDWVLTNQLRVNYTNLAPGNYILKVRDFGNKVENGEPKEIMLGITIHSPWFATVWAFLVYFLVVASIVYSFWRVKMARRMLALSLAEEKNEKERIEEVNKMKLRFFTNISHEFRTPLTLIIGQVEMLLQMEKLAPVVNKRLRGIHKNAVNLRLLITELLDFRKQEQGFMKLKVERVDVISFVKDIYQLFVDFARKRNMEYTFEHVEEEVDLWFDPVQMQKVVFNLLSNAFKYTSNKGNITVEVRKVASQAVVSVCDTGIGIPVEHISKIFDRFYQTDNASSSSSFTLGTGIGLALAKGIMNMHHGKIEVESTVGEGTKFILSLPLGNRHFSDEEMAVTEGRESLIIPEASVSSYGQLMAEEIKEPESQKNMDEEDKPTILLVDDNTELLSMLEDIFLPMYNVYTACNGREGLEMAQQIQPDLIVSDVIMPEMSGKDLCYKIKTNVELSHISVVLLTAQTSVEYVVEGLMFGADDYITKPFNIKVLVARCNNLIKNKKRLIAHYAGKVITESPVAEAINEKDKELLTKCVNIVRENFENPDFDVTALASELCMGRSKLYMQFKQMTGLTPNEFILKVKLDEAMSLLTEHPELNITEISVRLGFSSPRYFSKSFKAFFGIAPQGVRSRKE